MRGFAVRRRVCMQEFRERLAAAMKAKNIRAAGLAARSGVSPARISQYLHGVYQPKGDAVLRLAGALGVSASWLLGEDCPMNLPSPTQSVSDVVPSLPDNLVPVRLRRYPVLGDIACGKPILAQDNGEHYVNAADTDADFCLIAKGDSMIGARIYDGDEVFIQQADMVENGEIAAVLLDDEATLKRLYYYPKENRLVLTPENPAYEPLIFTGEELNHVRILGRAVAIQGRLR